MDDVEPFVTRLLDASGPACADLNADGSEDGFDIDAFTTALIAGVCGH